MFEFLIRKNKREQKDIADKVTLGVNAKNLDKYSDAGREYVKGYSGYDASTGQKLQKSLFGIASGKPNMGGQRGYAAEVLDVSKRNAAEILKESDIRYSRVDDLPGHAINETPFDIMGVTADGREIIDLASQMKFNQGDAKSVVDQLVGKKFRGKYPHAQYSVPKDRFDSIKNALEEKETFLSQQLQRAQRDNNHELINSLEERIEFVQDTKKNLVPSKLTLAEAEQAVLNPVGTTVHNVAELGHEVGIQYAGTSALINGAVTFARCMSKVMNGEMTPSEAAAEISVETGKGAALGYITGQANTFLASALKNSSKQVLNKLGQSNAPAQIVSFATSVFRIVNERLDGKIDDERCFNDILKSGIGVVGTFKAGGLGMAIGGPVGAIVASVVSGVIIDSTYEYGLQTLKKPDLARKERIAIQQQCDELHQELEFYRTEFKSTYVAYTKQLTEIFGNSLYTMALALRINDADAFIGGANKITESLGGNVQFRNTDEFIEMVDSGTTFDF